MFFGSPCFLSTTKSPKTSREKQPQPNADEARFMLMDSSIPEGTAEVAKFPNPSCIAEGTYYVVANGRLYWLREIQPNVHPVSLFVDNEILNDRTFLATFEFDAIFIFTSLLYLEPDKFVSVPQRIHEVYRSSLDDSQGHKSLEAATLTLWNKNVNNVQERLGYLCDVVHELDAEAPLFKPDQAKFTTMLEYKVQCLEKAVRDSNLMMGAYCQSSETSHQNHVRKHHVSFKEGKLRLFAWSVISTMLNAEARRHLVPSNMTVPDTAATAEAKPSAAPIITSGNKAPKKRKVAMAKGTPSITAFFKAA
ncbi:ribonuclease H2 subunit B, putative [Babesia caballi]|uniref:Ribonuclease H2 subunit B, putative n=1 Tax=Babesia caballi TaxID=5871 RepID=A0AAV4LQX7_BABCB|nr:ribonuclease H2 subunit B, putative [Babesia caballi]